jgi:hypothetical protein
MSFLFPRLNGWFVRVVWVVLSLSEGMSPPGFLVTCWDAPGR